ncbi:hypothetical protein [Streptomyces bohaiensis]|uniref:Uncharacterized protein n=1 Tax=Streptomyces bohaiensis TaxID=1431344 RepID=A0ABX1CAE6_9ACTN|nr:hypothetical protein [Streptomyces bohaiensis]NJQ14227.1 hypothetical protein [Streptomyces bohaiensis]
MSKKTTYSLDELRQRAADRKGGDKLTITAGGKPFSIPMPGFWPDEVKRKALSSRSEGDEPFIRALMGSDAFDRFVAAGGRTDDINLLLQEYKEAQGADLGESSAS